MSTKFLIPSRFLLLMGQIILSSYLLQTRNIFSSSTSLLVASCLILSFAICQFIFIISGINISNIRINVQNFLLSFITVLLLIWFAFEQWPGQYVFYIWGFLCIYPLLNEVVGAINVTYMRGRFYKFST